MGMMESFKFLLTSRYVRDLATLVVAYGISINLVEVTQNSKLKARVIYVRSQVLWQHNSCSYMIHICIIICFMLVDTLYGDTYVGLIYFIQPQHENQNFYNLNMLCNYHQYLLKQVQRSIPSDRSLQLDKHKHTCISIYINFKGSRKIPNFIFIVAILLA